MAEDFSRAMYAGRHVLDHEIVGMHGELVGKVDDIEISDGPSDSPVVTALLTGQIAYSRRFKGPFGRWLRTSAQRLRGQADTGPQRFDVTLIGSIGHTVNLNVPAAETRTPDLEAWLSEHFIGRIPGS